MTYTPPRIERAMTPQRIQLSRRRGFRLPLNAKSVARPHRWGNPFKVVHPSEKMMDWGYGGIIPASDVWQVVRANRSPGDGHYGRFPTEKIATDYAVELYRSWLAGQHISGMGNRGVVLAGSLPTLRGYDLACFCRLDSACHADVLLELANS